MSYRAGSMREKQMNTENISPSSVADKAHQVRKSCAKRCTFAVCFALVAVCNFHGRALCAADAADPKKWVADNLTSLVELYRHLHQTPELSQQEQETSFRMANELADVG